LLSLPSMLRTSPVFPVSVATLECPLSCSLLWNYEGFCVARPEGNRLVPKDLYKLTC
jgi:hypothetical protein